MTPARRVLPQRRPSVTFNFVCGPHSYTATLSYFPGTNQLVEIFLGTAAQAPTSMRLRKTAPSFARSPCSLGCRLKRSAAPYCATRVAWRRLRLGSLWTPSPATKRSANDDNQSACPAMPLWTRDSFFRAANVKDRRYVENQRSHGHGPGTQ